MYLHIKHFYLMIVKCFRALHLILLFFERIVETHKTGEATEDLVAFLREAYKETLEPYHGWLAQQLFNVTIYFSIYAYKLITKFTKIIIVFKY